MLAVLHHFAADAIQTLKTPGAADTPGGRTPATGAPGRTEGVLAGEGGRGGTITLAIEGAGLSRPGDKVFDAIDLTSGAPARAAGKAGAVVGGVTACVAGALGKKPGACDPDWVASQAANPLLAVET
jgi:hypothetical protein